MPRSTTGHTYICDQCSLLAFSFFFFLCFFCFSFSFTEPCRDYLNVALSIYTVLYTNVERLFSFRCSKLRKTDKQTDYEPKRTARCIVNWHLPEYFNSFWNVMIAMVMKVKPHIIYRMVHAKMRFSKTWCGETTLFLGGDLWCWFYLPTLLRQVASKWLIVSKVLGPWWQESSYLTGSKFSTLEQSENGLRIWDSTLAEGGSNILEGTFWLDLERAQ